MSDTQTCTEFRFFLLPQWEEEGAYLRSRHQQGWRLVKVSGLGSYRFEACPPEDVIYQLDYDPLPMAQKLQYLQTFQDCGWEYLQDYAGFSYFRKPAAALQPGEEGIFGDEASRQAMVTRLFRQRLLMLLPAFFCLVLPNFLLYQHGGFTLLRWVFNGLLLTYLVIFVWMAYHYWRLTRK